MQLIVAGNEPLHRKREVPPARVPSDGVRVGRWRVALLMGTVFADHAGQHFPGEHSVS